MLKVPEANDGVVNSQKVTLEEAETETQHTTKPKAEPTAEMKAEVKADAKAKSPSLPFVFLLSCSVVSCHSLFSVIHKAFCSDARWNQSVCTHGCQLCVLCRQRDFVVTILVIIIFLTFLSETIQEKRENHFSFVGIYCIPLRTQKLQRSIGVLERRGSCRAQSPA